MIFNSKIYTEVILQTWCEQERLRAGGLADGVQVSQPHRGHGSAAAGEAGHLTQCRLHKAAEAV